VSGGSVSKGQNTNAINVAWTTKGTGSVAVTESVALSGCFGKAVKIIIVTAKPVTSTITHN